MVQIMQNQILEKYKKVYQKPQWESGPDRKIVAVSVESHAFMKEECSSKKMKMHDLVELMIECYKKQLTETN